MFSQVLTQIKRIAPMVALMCGIHGAHATTVLPNPTLDTPLEKSSGVSQSIVLAGGCFWGVQAVFQHLKGVTDAQSGYAGGEAATAHYEIVSQGTTNHAEAVKVTYDPSLITLGSILKIFFSVAHDPTELNRQGPDHGTQYRSAVFTSNSDQQKIVQAYVDQLNGLAVFPKPLATKIENLQKFYPAEDYHQNYAKLHPNNPYIAIHDLPKVTNLKDLYPELFVP